MYNVVMGAFHCCITQVISLQLYLVPSANSMLDVRTTCLDTRYHIHIHISLFHGVIGVHLSPDIFISLNMNDIPVYMYTMYEVYGINYLLSKDVVYVIWTVSHIDILASCICAMYQLSVYLSNCPYV